MSRAVPPAPAYTVTRDEIAELTRTGLVTCKFMDGTEIDLCLEGAVDQPVMEEGLAELDLNAVAARLQSLSDVERGQLMEKVGGAAGIVGSLVRQAADQLEGFPADVRVPALLLLAAGIADQAGEP